ncbi:hypothetical protein E2C01_019032 [Portunus trituberculatus]|uniref:Uncharacterized protein n=1 Tax=Portunus trituberculatus TaxID=210409 RepID=A0A5B7DWU6_PORTR|nr:hypothetical protein [Portunus trituberculatus]
MIVLIILLDVLRSSLRAAGDSAKIENSWWRIIDEEKKSPAEGEGRIRIHVATWNSSGNVSFQENMESDPGGKNPLGTTTPAPPTQPASLTDPPTSSPSLPRHSSQDTEKGNIRVLLVTLV